MEQYCMKEMTWLEFDRRRKETDLVIIPTGACEVYGPHLPLGSDTIVSEEIARRLAARIDAVVAPSVQMGESFGLGEFPGTIVIRTESFKCYVEDILVSLIKWGFKRYLFLNMHAGNVPIISRLCREYQQNEGIRCIQIDWWRFVKQHCAGVLQYEDYMAHGHAGECGTSVMMYLRPELVDHGKIRNAHPKKPEHYTEYTDILKYPAFSQLTDCGSVGDATAADPEKGEEIVARCLARMEEYVAHHF